MKTLRKADMSSRWEHYVCGACYAGLQPGRKPTRVIDAKPGICCACGKRHASGIFMRANPASMACRGQHDDEPEAA